MTIPVVNERLKEGMKVEGARPPASLDVQGFDILKACVVDGLTTKELALRFQVSESIITSLRRSPLWKHEEEVLKEDIKNQQRLKLSKHIDTAVGALVDIMQPFSGDEDNGVRANPPDIRLKAAAELLDRVGLDVKHDAQKKSDNNVQVNFQVPKWGKDK